VNGLFKSMDSAAHWAFSGLDNLTVQSLAIDPDDSNTVYAATFAASGATGLYRGNDGGASWSRTDPPT
jgi:hypothetical protein